MRVAWLWGMLLVAAASAGAKTFYVDPPKGIQAALDAAEPGDTVWLRAGVFRERVKMTRSGKHSAPITLTGDPGAIIDGSDAVTLDWQPATDVAPGVWRAKVPGPVYTLTCDGKIVTMLREDRVKADRADAWAWPKLFRDGVGPSKFAGVKALALYRDREKELLIRFDGDLEPRGKAFTVSPREPMVRIDGANRCVVRGLTLRNASYGVLIENSVGSVVEQCHIGPADYGVWLAAGSDRCTVRFCELFMDPLSGADPHQPGAWDNWQAHKTGGHYDRYGVAIRNTVGGHEIHDNDIHDHWDGIEDVGKPGENRGLRIHHNRIYNVSDDGLEPNGAEEDCQWHDNTVQRSICGFRIKAPTAGPLYAYRNLFAGNSEDFRNYGEVELRPAVVFIYHNTCTARAAITSNKVFGIGTPRYTYANNLFWCAQWWSNSAGGSSVPPNWTGDYNVYVRRDERPAWDEGKALAAKLGLDPHSTWATGAPGFTDADQFDLSLTDASPALGRGGDLAKLVGRVLPGCEPGYFRGDAPAAGALQPGEPMPRLPRQATAIVVPAAGSWPGPEADAPPPPPTPLANGSFETGLAEWGKAPATAQVIAGEAADGGQFLRLTNPGARLELARRLGGLVVGHTYELAFSSRGSTVADARIIVRNLANQGYLGQTKPAADATWRRQTIRFAAPADTVGLEISLRAPGTVDLDSFTLSLIR